MKKYSEITKLSSAEMAKELKEARGKLREFRVGMSGSRVKNVKEGKNLRKTIARVLTAARKGVN